MASRPSRSPFWGAWVRCVTLIILLVALGYWANFFVLFQASPLINTIILTLLGTGMGLTFLHFFKLAHAYGIFEYKPHKIKMSSEGLLRPLIELYQQNPYAPWSQVRHTLDLCRERVDFNMIHYLAGALVFMGLLGTLWGLSETILMISDVIAHLPTQEAGDFFFETLKEQLRKPLAGMGLAFSSSLFGVGGSLTLHFFLVQAEKVKEAFFQVADQWAFVLFAHSPAEKGEEIDFLRTYLGRWLEGIDRLGRLAQLTEKRQSDLCEMIVAFGEKTQSLAELMKAQHAVLNRWSEEQLQMRYTLERVGQKIQEMAFSGDETIKTYLSQLTVINQEILKILSVIPLEELGRSDASGTMVKRRG